MLSVGGPSGLAHLGVIESLRAHNVEISCVVGNSMGALVGALYANNPSQDTSASFASLLAEYETTAKGEAAGRFAIGGLLGLAWGPLGALAGGMAGAGTVQPIQHARLVEVLERHLAWATIETLPVKYATSYAEQRDEKAHFHEVQSGSLARAVGGSLANPFIFKEIDVRIPGQWIDPGMDRVAAVPIEQSCSTFPAHRILAINVMEQRPFVSTDMKCPMFEIRVPAPHASAGAVLSDAATRSAIIAAGRAAGDAWFASSDGAAFLASARRATPAPAALPAPYVVQVLSAQLAPTKPSGHGWDVGSGTADARVRVIVRGEGRGELATEVAQDTLSPTWATVAPVELALGDRLEIHVWDSDPFESDLIVSTSARFVGPQRYVLRAPEAALAEIVVEVRRGSD